MMVWSGDRSSWDTLARNIDRCRLSSRSWVLACCSVVHPGPGASPLRSSVNCRLPSEAAVGSEVGAGSGNRRASVVTSSPDYEARARIDWLVKYRDQPCSFPDVVSFASMRERHIRGAPTLDHHFSTAGFVMVSSRVDA